jgi:hypothetical protein
MIAIYGHPEDAVAIALASYALVFTFEDRFVGAGWLFGAAVGFQPLVLLMLPALLAVVGRSRMLGLGIRSLLPAGVLLIPPLIADFRATLHDIADQPNFPNLNHVTPWTALSPSLGGHGLTLTVASGPGRVLAILIAIAIGVWLVPRWRDQPERVVFTCALALSLRGYTESVMIAYYSWAALALAVVVAAQNARRNGGGNDTGAETRKRRGSTRKIFHRGQPAVGLCSGQRQHLGLVCADPDSDVMCRFWTTSRPDRRVVDAVVSDDARGLRVP